MTEVLNATDAVLSANLEFYRAFAHRDVPAMERLWATKADVTCIHAGWRPSIGREAVLDSWRSILGGREAPAILCHDERALLHGLVAVVVCEEDLGAATLFATNLFVNEAGSWRMVGHQSSPAFPL